MRGNVSTNASMLYLANGVIMMSSRTTLDTVNVKLPSLYLLNRSRHWGRWCSFGSACQDEYNASM